MKGVPMLEANNHSELLSNLSKIDISVPLRSEGRTKDHTERYAVAHLLSALSGTDLIEFPLKLTQRERPDFLLSMASCQIGIEHTEAVPQNEAHKTVLREKGHGPEMHFLSRSDPGETKKTAKDLIREIEANDAGEGWAGDSVEREWVEAIFYFVKQKVDKLLKDGFEKFDKDWLLIYDNWSLPALDREKAVPLLLSHINSGGVLQEFDFIFVLTGPHLCAVSRGGIRLYDTNDIW